MSKINGNSSVSENNNYDGKINIKIKKEQSDLVSAFEESVNQTYGNETYLLQSVDGDNRSVFETDIYIHGDENYFSAVMKNTDVVSKEEIEGASLKIDPNISIYNTNIYDNQKRLTLTTTGTEVTLYEEKVKDEETGIDNVEQHLSVYYEQNKLHHGGLDPEMVYGFNYKTANSSVKKKQSREAKDFNKEENMGKLEINAEWKKNEGLQKISFGNEIGHGTTLNIGKEGDFYTATLTHEKKSENYYLNTQEEFGLKYHNKKNFSLSYNVDNKGITKWGINAEKQDGENRYGIFFQKPL